MSDHSLLRFSISIQVVCLQRHLAVCVAQPVPREAAAVSAHVLCTQYNHAPVYSVCVFVYVTACVCVDVSGRTYICVCLCLCVCYLRVFNCASLRLCVSKFLCVYLRLPVSLCIYLRVSAYVPACVCVSVYVPACVCVSMCVHADVSANTRWVTLFCFCLNQSTIVWSSRQ